MHISITRDALLDKLRENQELAKADDILAKKKHEQDEQRAVKLFREKLTAAMKWTYPEMKKRRFEVELGYDSRPECPKAELPKIQRVIQEVLLDKREAYTLAPNTDVFDAVLWLPKAKRPKPDMCG